MGTEGGGESRGMGLSVVRGGRLWESVVVCRFVPVCASLCQFLSLKVHLYRFLSTSARFCGLLRHPANSD